MDDDNDNDNDNNDDDDDVEVGFFTAVTGWSDVRLIADTLLLAELGLQLDVEVLGNSVFIGDNCAADDVVATGNSGFFTQDGFLNFFTEATSRSDLGSISERGPVVISDGLRFFDSFNELERMIWAIVSFGSCACFVINFCVWSLLSSSRILSSFTSFDGGGTFMRNFRTDFGFEEDMLNKLWLCDEVCMKDNKCLWKECLTEWKKKKIVSSQVKFKKGHKPMEVGVKTHLKVAVVT